MRELISLGQRCDVAFQLRCHSGNNVAHFFDWLVSPLDSVIGAFERDFEVFSPDHLETRFGDGHRYVHDRVSGFTFHHQFPTVGPHVTDDYLLFYPGFAAKFRHLAERFRAFATARPVTLVRRDVDRPGAERLERAFFSRFPGADARFVYVAHAGAPFETDHGRSVVLDRPKAGLGDVVAWAEMLVAQGLVETPFRLSAEEVLGRDQDDHALIGVERFGVEQLRAAVLANPGNTAWRLDLARCCGRRGLWDEAVDVLCAATDRSSTPGLAQDLTIQTAFARWKAGQASIEAAMAELGPDVQAGSASLGAAIDCIDLLMAGLDHEAALRVCGERLEASAVVHGLYVRRANCLARLGRPDQALPAIDAAIRLSPSIPSYHQIKAGILAELKRVAEAVAVQEEAVRLGGGYGACQALGNLLFRAGRKPEALQAYREALRVRPEGHPFLIERVRQLEEELS